MTFLCDQLGLNARNIEDILLYDKALTAHPDDPAQAPIAALHDSAAAAVAARPASDIKIGQPLFPFVNLPHGCEKRLVLFCFNLKPFIYIKIIILPRQARDEQGKS
jgi:Asp-tRNA(Asn)/Glu-tRNA(Gln) amidotransferase A subunit family amidase